jgi:hypothetical protein
MAFGANTVVRVNALTVGQQVVAAVAADGHCYVNPTPTTTGATYPAVRKLIPADIPPGTDSAGAALDSADVLWTVQLTGSAFALPIDFTLNVNTDYVIVTTGSAA